MFAKYEDDWMFLNDRVIITTINEYSNRGYGICIMTNQVGLIKGHITEDAIKYKLEKIVNPVSHHWILFNIYHNLDWCTYPSPNRL